MRARLPIIGVVGAPNEMHSRRMVDCLQKKGAQPVLLDTLNFPEKATFSLRDGRIFYNGAALDDLAGCYVRSVFYSHPPYDLEHKRNAGGRLETDNWYRDFQAERERQSLLSSVLRVLAMRDIPVVNPVETFDLHYLKPLQLAMLRRAGIPVPATLVTNNPDELVEFRKEKGSVVYKPVAGGAQCRELKPQDLEPERLEALRNAPVLFQELVPGENVRVYVLGERILTAAVIESEEIDYRGSETSIRPVDLPEEVRRMCIEAMRVCGYRFTGMDLRRRPDGGYVVIECNPSAMFMGFEQALGIDIAGPLADYLMGRS